ncbi:MAG: hypothetical protein BWY74_03731 [Firmicutes bacterium ADurb.Bin419]|nr:MAG: hypothetical protein BWY74_03731 [Firmicutes bacterium ADurb.Bin419]
MLLKTLLFATVEVIKGCKFGRIIFKPETNSIKVNALQTIIMDDNTRMMASFLESSSQLRRYKLTPAIMNKIAVYNLVPGEPKNSPRISGMFKTHPSTHEIPIKTTINAKAFEYFLNLDRRLIYFTCCFLSYSTGMCADIFSISCTSFFIDINPTRTQSDLESLKEHTLN